MDGNRLVPYYTREEIDFQSRLAGRGLEIVWIDSLVDIFFLHIQGSGIVQLEDGSRIFVGYADQNGHPFKSHRQVPARQQLIDRGQLSLQGMKAFLKEHPEAIPEALTANPSYIFFQINEQSATGTFGTRLTPWRSVASDPRLFPLGTLAYIECEKPLFDAAEAHHRLGEVRPLRPQPGHRRRHPRRRPRRPLHRPRRTQRARRRRHEAEGGAVFPVEKITLTFRFISRVLL